MLLVYESFVATMYHLIFCIFVAVLKDKLLYKKVAAKMWPMYETGDF